MKIKVTEGKYDKTCITELSLMDNQLVKPIISDIMQYTEQRNLITYIVSGAKYGTDTAPRDTKLKTVIGQIPESKLVGSSGYRYRVMGRIQKPSPIVSQVGVATAGGYFQLVMQNDLLYPGLTATFANVRQEARVQSAQSGTVGNYIYTFKTTSGEQFDWNTWVAPMAEKKLFGGYTTYGEKSLRGYSRTFFPDTYIGHTTIQRKTTAQTGSVTPNVLWVQMNNEKGWYMEAIAQTNKQMTLEDEFQKMWGRTNMRDANGNLKERSGEIDEEGGFEITRGSGIWEQIEGINDAWTSGVNGKPTYDDFRSMMKTLRPFSMELEGNLYYVLTGEEGKSDAYDVLEERSRTTYNLTMNQDGSNKIGGPDLTVGYNFVGLNVDGNQAIFVEHPMMSDRERWHEEAIDGTRIMGGSYVFICASAIGNTGRKNIEIMGRGAYGVNRSFISGTIAGMTGYYQSLGMKAQSSVDGDEYHTLKEDGIFIYNTKCCGILHRSKM